MADTRTEKETFPKASWTSEQVDAVRAGHLDAGAVSCEKSDDNDNYYLTTVWNVL
jgi:hypothetical protein